MDEESARGERAERIIKHIKDRHQERAAGALFYGPHGACSVCMLPYPCPVMKAIQEAEEA